MTVRHAIDVENLTFSWAANMAPVLEIPKLSVEQGSSLFVQGSSGSGKSTLLNILSGVISPNSGDVKLLGQPFSALKQKERDRFRADHIGYIFQQFNLLPYLTVLENVALPANISLARRHGNPKKSPEILEEVKHWLTQLKVPSSLYDQKVTRLSIGQQQRVAAARAIIGSPEIIIADEPTSALDSQNVDNFMSVLVEQCKRIGSTLIFVSHDENLSTYFDASFHLKSAHEGEIV